MIDMERIMVSGYVRTTGTAQVEAGRLVHYLTLSSVNLDSFPVHSEEEIAKEGYYILCGDLKQFRGDPYIYAYRFFPACRKSRNFNVVIMTGKVYNRRMLEGGAVSFLLQAGKNRWRCIAKGVMPVNFGDFLLIEGKLTGDKTNYRIVVEAYDYLSRVKVIKSCFVENAGD